MRGSGLSDVAEQICQALPGGLVRLAADGRIVATNARAREFFGLRDDASALDLRWGETFLEDGRTCPPEMSPGLRCLASGRPEGPRTLGVRTADGQTRWGVFQAFAVRDADGGAGVVVTFDDVTARVTSDGDDGNERSRLDEATRRLESVGVFAGGMAHQCNNLLVGMMGYADLALRHVPASSRAFECIEMVLRCARQAEELTKQLLAYAGRARTDMADLSLTGVVQSLAGALRASVPKQIRLSLELAADLPAIRADESQLRQVVMSLVTNAHEAIGQAIGDIAVSTQRVSLDAGALAGVLGAGSLAAGEYACLEVCDTGVGMDDRTRHKLFEPFFSTKFPGRGLGLSAVFGIVRGHGGALSVASEPGKGTRFRLYFALSTTRRPQLECGVGERLSA